MTKDDIMRMAREAGFMPTVLNHWPNELERFANLVAAHKAEVALAEAYRCGYEAGVVAERDALEAELLKLKKGIGASSMYIQGRWDLIGEFQDIIRARGMP